MHSSGNAQNGLFRNFLFIIHDVENADIGNAGETVSK